MKMNKLQSTKELDPEWLSEHQRKMLRDQYLENLRDGLKPKEAINKALKMVLCCN